MASSSDTPDYHMSHRPADHTSGDPFHDVTRTIYPDDFYTLPQSTVARYYGTGEDQMDIHTVGLIRAAHKRPFARITIYRAIPSTVLERQINPGDWVTPSKAYAKSHGERWESYVILQKTVPTHHLYTDGNSIHEWGYDPDAPPVPPRRPGSRSAHPTQTPL